ncbi:MAG TPA: alkaline phosphatase D family protein [Luteolibacter sp.]|nr:alkaline phosphatase D family protein [Luteolibacter sp.]
MKRRDFIALTSGIPLVAAVSADAQVAPEPKPKKGTPQIPPLDPIPGPPCLMAGPMLGHVSDSSAALWIQSTKPTDWAVDVSENPEFTGATSHPGTATVEASGLNAQIVLGNLKPATRYHYRIRFGDQVVSPIPAPSFTTAPVAGTAGKLRFGFSSCVGRLPEHAAAAWGEINARRNFDLFLMLGDNHYADSTDPAKQRLYYTAHRRNPSFRDFTSHLPVYGIWDDHDYGPNNSDSTAEGKERSPVTFREFWPNPPRTEESQDPAIYHHFQRGDVAFFMLDVRYHRTPNEAPDGEAKTMLGAAQLGWLKRNLKASTAKVKVIASGSEWQTNGSGDSWAKFLHERDPLLDFIEAEKIGGVMFISGDRHFAGGYQVRDRWIELTSGPLGSTSEKTTKGATYGETFTVFVGNKMWTIVDVDTSGAEPRISMEIWGAGKGLLERRDFSWPEFCGVEKMKPSQSIS